MSTFSTLSISEVASCIELEFWASYPLKNLFIPFEPFEFFTTHPSPLSFNQAVNTFVK